MTYKAPRGTRDILPDETWKWQRIEAVFRETAARFGYREIRFPVFEETELFARGIGDATDIVRKEMYTFSDRKGRSLTLRPEGTASVVRSYLEHSMGRSARLTKLSYFCPMFRYERPQAGRYRQFWQWGLEAIGSPSPTVDAEIIDFSVRYFAGLGIRETTAKLNSAGCPKCTPAYNDLLREALAPRLDEFCGDCRERLDRNPRRVFDCKNERCRAALDGAPSILDALCDECREHFDEVRALLSGMAIEYVVDPGLARGLDYYTKTIFEVHHAKLGAQGALCGGGRYDGLVEELGGKATPACGVSAGVERLVIALENEGLLADGHPGPDVYLVSVGERAAARSAALVSRLRETLSVETDYQGRSTKAQMREAGRMGARYALIIGDEELERGTAVLHDMRSGEEEDVAADGVAAALTERIGRGSRDRSAG